MKVTTTVSASGLLDGAQVRCGATTVTMIHIKGIMVYFNLTICLYCSKHVTCMPVHPDIHM